ncbi:UDP-glucuronosyltransferase 2B31 [Strongylocentrotus purpuratus]|uniref:Glucuronosyltransferase n=1 Tax=Strongylocentrotus purpuratus TaxID=7668 RepID=A0A7M7SUT6_STRPU|nr:UDP-glucuronosyltransferase 2B31 [Strongylocentrotus purpuratus]|eukprot:XP_003728156.1 PREDICTED: UDP-glucuronosyltransferase 2B31-like [Strongylocentrotus purpuratus]
MDQRSLPTILRIFLLVWVCQEVQPANILMVGFVGKGSHFLCLLPIGRSLVSQGHNVSLLTSDEYMERANDPELRKLFNFEIYKNTDPRYNTKKYFHLLEELGFSENGDLISFFKTMTSFNEIISKTCQFVLEDKEMMKRFEKLDAIVTDMGWPCGGLIKLHLKKYSNNSRVRLIWTTPTTPNVAMLDISGSPANPAYQPAIMSSYTSNMTFIERTINTLSTYGLRLFMKMASYSFSTFAEGVGLGDELATIDNMLTDITDLVLASFDFAVEFPFPKSPGLIPVGGLTAGPPNDLPQELEDFIQSSGDDGIVVFTLGTYFANFATSRPHLLKMFIDALAKIPQKVIMQLKVMPEYDLPPNIKALPWLPQNDLLGHPKTRLFMYHGGNNGFYEAVYHGVPIIVLPFFGDQLDTAARITSRGMGLQLDKLTLSVDLIHHHLTEVLGDERYSLAAKRLSAILRDRPMNPADRAAFWIQHVIKHGGEYMRSPAHDLSFIQYNLIDVYAFIASVLALFLFLVYKIMRCCVSCCMRKKVGTKDKSD